MCPRVSTHRLDLMATITRFRLFEHARTPTDAEQDRGEDQELIEDSYQVLRAITNCAHSAASQQAGKISQGRP